MALHSLKMNRTIPAAGKSLGESLSLSGEDLLVKEVPIPAAQPGTLTLRTNNTTGTLTMDIGGHGIVDADLVDLYWDVGGVKGYRRSVVVGVVAGTSVPISGGSGDNLPAQDSAIRVHVQVEKELNFEGDDVVALIFSTPVRGTFILAGADDAEDMFKHLGAGCSYVWHELGCGEDNPIAGDTIAKVFITHGELSEKFMKVGVLFN